jgi:hypothetical protein
VKLQRLIAGWSIFLLGFLTCSVLGAQPPAANADPTLEEFMKKWKIYRPFQIPTQRSERPLLVAALARDPAGPWFDYLQLLAFETTFQLRQKQGPERRSLAADLLPLVRQGEEVLSRAAAESADNSALSQKLIGLQGTFNILSLEAGENLGGVRTNAQRLLAQAGDTNHWNYGNVIYEANSLLGRVAVREGAFAEARRCLRAAGRTPGSPQLGSFGPNLALARELLEQGGPEDRETVLAFLEDLKNLWPDPATIKEANRRQVAADHRQELEAWRGEIGGGKIPDSRPWR